MSAGGWVGMCVECKREGVEVETRIDHAAKVLCDRCAERPHLLPSTSGMYFPPDDAFDNGSPRHRGQSDPNRYEGRELDLGALLAEPLDSVPYVVDRFAVRGGVTMLFGTHGIGKSAFAVTLAATAHTGGGQVAGVDVVDARALVIDAEQGRRVIKGRAHALSLPPDLGYVEAGGLDARNGGDRRFLRTVIKRRGVTLVVADSLLRMAPGVRENDDEMRVVVEAWAEIAREEDAAVILLGHRGKDDGVDYRGHSTIGDVPDAAFVLERVKNDRQRGRRRLRVSKFRIDEEPDDRWLRLTAFPFGVAEAEPFEKAPVRSKLEDELLAAIARGFPMTQAAALRAVDRKSDDKTGRAAIASMLANERLVRDDDLKLRPASGVAAP